MTTRMLTPLLTLCLILAAPSCRLPDEGAVPPGTEMMFSRTSKYGWLVLGVESEMDVERIDMCSDIRCFEVGPFHDYRDVYSMQLRPDTYCVSHVIIDHGDQMGTSHYYIQQYEVDNSGLCFDVSAGYWTYYGHVVFDPDIRGSLPGDVGLGVGLQSFHLDIDRIIQNRYPNAFIRVPYYIYDSVTRLNRTEDEIPLLLLRSDINESMLPAYQVARACASQVGAPAYTPVRIQFTIDGPTGRIYDLEVFPFNFSEGAAMSRCISEGVVFSDLKTKEIRASDQRFMFYVIAPARNQAVTSARDWPAVDARGTAVSRVQVAPTGALPPRVVAAAIGERSQYYRWCYSAGMFHELALAGSFGVDLQINANGFVVSSLPNHANEFSQPEVAQCVAYVATTCAFPPPTSANGANVSFVFTFDPP